MARPLKIVLLVFGGLLALIIAALVAAVLMFNPNDYRQQIADAVQKETGRSLQLGEIGMKIFPWLNVSIRDAKLGNAPGFGEQPFAEVRQVSVGVELLPLLRDRQVKASTVTLDGLHVNLARNAQGLSNWQDLLDRQKQQAAAEKPEEKPESGKTPTQIDIAGIKIRDAALVYDDQQAGKHYEVQKLKLDTGALDLKKPFDLDFAATLISRAPEAQVDVALSGRIEGDIATQKLSSQNFKLTVKGKAAGYELDTQLGAQLAADLAGKIFNLQNLKLSIEAANPGLPGGKQTVQLRGDLAYNVPAGALRFAKAELQAGGLTLQTDLTGKNLAGEEPMLYGPVKIAPFSPRKLLESFGVKLQTTDEKALGTASLSANYVGSFKTASLRDLNLILDQTKASGHLDVTDFKTLALGFALNMDGIDADRYLPPKVEKPEVKNAPVDSATAKAARDATPLPTALLDKLNAEGTAQLGKLTIHKLKLSSIRLQLAGRGGNSKQQSLSANLYGGSVKLTQRYTPGATPGFAWSGNLDGFQAAPFLLDLTGKDYVSGTAALSMDLSGRGKTLGAVRQTLNGKLAAEARNGAVKGFNLGQILRKADAMLSGNMNYQEPATAPETDFSTISVSGTVNNGVLSSNDLNAASPLFRVGGEGSVDLARETIDYTVKPTVVNTATGQSGKALENLNGVMVPIRLTGNLFKPKYKIDVKQAVRQKATEKVREQIKEKREELKQKLGDQLNKFLFGKPKPQPSAPAESAPTPAAPESAPAPSPPSP